MTRILAWLALLVLAAVPAAAQEPATVQGRVTSPAQPDSGRPEPRPEDSVMVWIEELGLSTRTARDGTYRLVIPGHRIPPAGTVMIQVGNRVGLSRVSRRISVSPGVALVQNFQLSRYVRDEVWAVVTGGPAVIHGRIGSHGGRPEPAVLVRVEELGASTATAADGTYRLVIPPDRIRLGDTVTVNVSRVGISPVNRYVVLRPDTVVLQNFSVGPSVITEGELHRGAGKAGSSLRRKAPAGTAHPSRGGAHKPHTPPASSR